jgi:hypothetical protein
MTGCALSKFSFLFWYVCIVLKYFERVKQLQVFHFSFLIFHVFIEESNALCNTHINLLFFTYDMPFKITN